MTNESTTGGRWVARGWKGRTLTRSRRLEGCAGDIDHIVVGPTGVFVVETKNHSGTISLKSGCLYGKGELLSRDFVCQATAEAMYVKGRLKPRVSCHVRPLVVFTRAKGRVQTAVGGVWVVALSSLIDTIVSREPSLSPEDIGRYAERLEDIGISSASRSAREPWGGVAKTSRSLNRARSSRAVAPVLYGTPT
jgi:hypothetical protein